MKPSLICNLLFLSLAGCADAFFRGDPAHFGHLASSLTCKWPSSLPVTTLSLEHDASLEAIGDSLANRSKDLETFNRDHADWKAKRMAYVDATAKVWAPPLFIGDLHSWIIKLWYLNGDLKDLKVKREEYLVANEKMQESIEKLLETPHADAAEVARIAEGRLGTDALIVFYAPWCPHCQTFVLHDENGNPLKAPVEVMRKEWATHDRLKRVKIYRSDVTKLGKGDLPEKMPVKEIPTMYFVTASGNATQYPDDPRDTSAVKSWAQSLMSR